VPVSDVDIEPDFIDQVVFVFESALLTDFLPAVGINEILKLELVYSSMKIRSSRISLSQLSARPWDTAVPKTDATAVAIA
jgi:hypothetical protein